MKMLTRIERLKELAKDYRVEQKGLYACQASGDMAGELVQLREIEDIAKAMVENIEDLRVLDKDSKEG